MGIVKFKPIILLLAILVTPCFLIGEPGKTLKWSRSKMGSLFEITAVHEDPAQLRVALDAAYEEIDRLEKRISSWISTSETAEVNRNAGKVPVAVSSALFGLVRRSIKISELTEGAFDITFAGFGQLWDFKAEVPVVPPAEAIAEAVKHVGYHHIQLDPRARSIFLDDPKTKIGLGAIGKGFAANRAAAVLKSHGVRGGVVNAGGDLLVFGRQENGQPWTVSIADPRKPGRIFGRVALSDQAIVTSGDYERFFLVDGKRYSHILHPKTGYPVPWMRSVTVLCPDAELADGLATAVFVMGVEKGLALINRLERVEALFIDGEGNHHFSTQIQSQFFD